MITTPSVFCFDYHPFSLLPAPPDSPMLISHHNRATSYQRKAASQTVPPLYAAIGRAVNLRFAFADATISADGRSAPVLEDSVNAARGSMALLAPGETLPFRSGLGITRSWLRCFDRRDFAAVR